MKIASLLFPLFMFIGCQAIDPTPISTELTPHESSKLKDIRCYFDLVNINAFNKQVNATIEWGKCENKKWMGLCTFRDSGVHKIEIDSIYFGNSTTANSMLLKGTIIHEMVHAYLEVGGHGPGFQRECDRVGKIMGVPSEYIYNKKLYKEETTP